MEKKQSLAGLSEEALRSLLPDEPPFRARQIFQWLAGGVLSFDAMTNLPVPLRETLNARFLPASSRVIDTMSDKDGTIKVQLLLEDGNRIESVLLVDENERHTACLSSQVGCAMGCIFCKTGSLGFRRNLAPHEIIEQFLHLRACAKQIENIVVMGMGEPLLNLPALEKAFGFLCEECGDPFSVRRITISTCGIIAGIDALAEKELGVRLAVSLTTADESLRVRLMPCAKNNPLSDLKKSLLAYQQKKRKRITLEMVLLREINTRAVDAERLADFADGLDAVVNLIPYNPVAGLYYNGAALQEPTRLEAAQFAESISGHGFAVTKRLSRGQGVLGACGQLGSLYTEDTPPDP